MSNLQFGTLRYLIHHDVEIAHLGIYNLTTLGSLIVHGWVERRGNLIGATQAGEEAYAAYHRASPNYRQHKGELSERVRLMLHINQLRMVKAAAS